MSQAFAQYPEGCRVRIEAVDTLAQAQPDAAGQARAKGLIGEERVVMEVDRYGYAWLSWDEDGSRADFCLRPSDLSLVAPAPPAPRAEEASSVRRSWKELREKRGEFAPSTVAVLAAFGVFVLAGASHRLLYGAKAPPDIDSIWFLLPAATVFGATIVAAIYALRRRRLQYILELVACAGLWIVLMRAA